MPLPGTKILAVASRHLVHAALWLVVTLGAVAGAFLRASDLGRADEGAEWKTVVLDGNTGGPVVPNGSLGFRWTDSGKGKWNLDLGDTVPRLSLYGAGSAAERRYGERRDRERAR